MRDDVRGMFTMNEAPTDPPGRSASATPRPQKSPRTDAARLPFVWTRNNHTREAELYRRVVRDLTRQIGGRPTTAQELLIARIAWLCVHIAHIDARALAGGEMSNHARREYLAWSNTLTRTLVVLGFQASPPPPANLADYLAARAAAAPDGEG